MEYSTWPYDSVAGHSQALSSTKRMIRATAQESYERYSNEVRIQSNWRKYQASPLYPPDV